MATLPLITHDSPTAVVAWRAGVPITATRFLADVDRVRASFGAGRHLLNACVDRYHFTVGLAAALVAEKVTLLPPTRARGVIRQLTAFAGDAFCLTDDSGCDINLPCVHYPGEEPAAPPLREVPRIDAAQLAAYLFTSGSTGAPLAHGKTWGSLVRGAHLAAARIDLLASRSYTIVSTAGPQHMYGFEFSVLLPLQSGNALCAAHPFYPADVCRELVEAARPRVLLSTPVHLRALLATRVALPAVDLIVSSTATLPQALAREVEAAFATPLLEIFGSTETGAIASRRTAQTAIWQLLPDIELTLEHDRAVVWGGHLEQPTVLCDVLEPLNGDRFLMHGRTADLVNIAGKRSSIAYLNHQLSEIPGVIDGTFLLRSEASASVSGVTRLAAIVVAPSLDARTLTQRLRERIDPAFLPRKLVFVAQLPRNATGKLPQDALLALLEAPHRRGTPH